MHKRLQVCHSHFLNINCKKGNYKTCVMYTSDLLKFISDKLMFWNVEVPDHKEIRNQSAFNHSVSENFQFVSTIKG